MGPSSHSRASTSWIECSSIVPAPALADVAPPGRAVHALHREVLVVAEDRGLHPAVARILRAGGAARGTPGLLRSTSPTWFTTPAVSTTSHSARASARRGGQRLLAEHGQAALHGAADQARGARSSRCRRRPRPRRRARSSSVAIGVAPDAWAKRGRALGVGVVHRRDHHVGTRVLQAHAVVRRDQAAAEEADADGHVFWTVRPPSTGITAPVRNDAAGSTTDSVMWATSSGSP